MCLGAATSGPVYIGGRRSHDRVVGFFDLESLRPTDAEIVYSVLGEEDFIVQSSSDGTVYSGTRTGKSSFEHEVVLVRGGQPVDAPGTASRRRAPGGADPWNSEQGMFVQQSARTSTDDGFTAGVIPAVRGEFYLSFSPPEYMQGKLDLHLVGDSRPLAKLHDIEPVTSDQKQYRSLEWDTRFPPRKRIWFLPQLNLLVTVPEPADRVVLQRIDIAKALAESNVDYLIATSRPPESAVKGEVFRYSIKALSKRGQLEYELVTGPPDMKLSPLGELVWPVPVHLSEEEQEVVISVRDASQQEVFHKFRLKLRDPVAASSAKSAVRLWIDSTGRFRVRAEFLGMADGDQVRLKKENGAVITVPLNRLSEPDQEYVRGRK
jgi:hypothetical protein